MHDPTVRMSWDKNIQSTSVLHTDNRMNVLHIVNKGGLGVTKRDFYEKKIAFNDLPTGETAYYFYFTSLPEDDECPINGDTIRADIYTGFHRFSQVDENTLKCELLLQCDYKLTKMQVAVYKGMVAQ